MTSPPPIPAELWDQVPPAAQAALLALFAQYQARVQRLEQRVAELEQRLGQNASNSSTPPSANPPSAPKPVVKKPTGRQTGGQPGHPGHARRRLPTERVDHVIALIPGHCGRCQAPLPQEPAPGDPEPTWHQVAELPRVAAIVTEFQGHARTCPGCGHVTRESIPAAITRDAFGPRLAAALGYLGGSQHVSQRGLEEVTEALFGVPVSLGAVNALQDELSQALQAPHREIRDAARQAPSKNVDETSWKWCGELTWLWVAATQGATYFLIQEERSGDALAALLGDEPAGVIGSDRFSAYNGLPLEQRQVCWAHLKRDFQAMADRGGAAAAVGEGLLIQVACLFSWWHDYQAGKFGGRALRRRMLDWLRPEVESYLRRGLTCGCAQTARTCANILELQESLWTFARVPGVEPTNNAAERALRPAVLRRKRSYGSQSAGGMRYVERLLSVLQTVRQRGGQVLAYLTEAIKAHRHGSPAPSVLALA